MSIRPLAPDFHVTGQIKPAQMQEVAGLGYKTLICMRPDNEGFNQPAFNEVAAAAKAAGIDAHHIPVAAGGAMTPEQAKRLKEIVTSRAGHVLAYCASGNRCAAAYEMAKKA